MLLAAYNPRTGQTLCDRARVAQTPDARRVGLLDCLGLPAGEGLCIVPCAAVHTLGMQFPIDVIFLDRENTVLMVAQMQPGAHAECREAFGVLELPAGTIAASGTQSGDRLELSAY